jgi:hypothetical protein
MAVDLTFRCQDRAVRYRRECDHCGLRWVAHQHVASEGRAGDRCPRCQSPSYRSRPAPFARADAAPLPPPAPRRRRRPLRATGWWADPTGRFDKRWWDGEGWTEVVLVDGEQAIDLNPTGLVELWEHPAVRAGSSRAS